MKTPTQLIGLAAVCAQAALAQQPTLPASAPVPVTAAVRATVTPAPAYEGERIAATAEDKAMIARADETRGKLESTLKEYLVAFDTQIPHERKRVGLPLASFGDRQWDVALDLGGKGVIAQWRFAQPRVVYGQKLDYQAFVGSTGTASLVVSSRF